MTRLRTHPLAIDEIPTIREYQPRFVAFAAAHALTPSEAHRTLALWWFMNWIATEWSVYFDGRVMPSVYSDADHAGFDAYLATRYPEVQP